MLYRRSSFAKRLRQAMHYDPDTGVFTWRIAKSSNITVGQIAGTITAKGRLVIKFDYKLYYAHRLAWLYMTDRWPISLIDHENCNPSDNHWDNLREATRVGNGQNLKKARTDNRSGFLGVSINRRGTNKRFYARIKADGRYFHLGYYSTPEEAHAAYVEAKRKLHEFNTL